VPSPRRQSGTRPPVLAPGGTRPDASRAKTPSAPPHQHTPPHPQSTIPHSPHPANSNAETRRGAALPPPDSFLKPAPATEPHRAPHPGQEKSPPTRSPNRYMPNGPASRHSPGLKENTELPLPRPLPLGSPADTTIPRRHTALRAPQPTRKPPRANPSPTLPRPAMPSRIRPMSSTPLLPTQVTSNRLRHNPGRRSTHRPTAPPATNDANHLRHPDNDNDGGLDNNDTRDEIRTLRPPQAPVKQTLQPPHPTALLTQQHTSPS